MATKLYDTTSWMNENTVCIGHICSLVSARQYVFFDILRYELCLWLSIHLAACSLNVGSPRSTVSKAMRQYSVPWRFIAKSFSLGDSFWNIARKTRLIFPASAFAGMLIGVEWAQFDFNITTLMHHYLDAPANDSNPSLLPSKYCLYEVLNHFPGNAPRRRHQRQRVRQKPTPQL